jgi:Zn-finger nucleic acid-binding protein
MAYRELTEPCPRCGVTLAKQEDGRKWRCRTCGGTLVAEDELVGLPGFAALEPRPADEAALACPLCGDPLAPVVLSSLEHDRDPVDVALDRCERDRVVWCDAGELGRIRTVASAAEADEACRARGQTSPSRDLVDSLLERIGL